MQQIFRVIDNSVQQIGREFDTQTRNLINTNPPDPNNMIQGRNPGWNYMGQAETTECRFMRLFMNLFRPLNDLILQIQPAGQMYTNYYFNTWRRYIGQYRYNLWQYQPGQNGYDPLAADPRYELRFLDPKQMNSNRDCQFHEHKV